MSPCGNAVALLVVVAPKATGDAFVFFFISVKLAVLARRVKVRMYAPGGIGFIAAQEDFARVTKSQRTERFHAPLNLR